MSSAWQRMGVAMQIHFRRIWAYRQFAHVPNLDEYGADHTPTNIRPGLDTDRHNVVISKTVTNAHYPVIDLDVPAYLVPSSTPDHSHLFINVPLTWGDYQYLLQALAKVGIIEEGYAEASQKTGFSAVRLPWVKKA